MNKKTAIIAGSVIAALIVIAGIVAILPKGDNGKKVDSQGEIKKDESKQGTIFEDSDIKKVPVFTDKALNRTGEIDGVKYNFKALQISKVTAKTQKTADLYQIPLNKEVALVYFTVELDNPTDKEMSFLSIPRISSNTREEGKMAFMFEEKSLNGNGALLPNTKRTGDIAFVFENSSAEEISELIIKDSRPHNMTDSTGNYDAKDFEEIFKIEKK